MDEEWRTVPELPDYEASDLGRVRNVRTKTIRAGWDTGSAIIHSGLRVPGEHWRRQTSRNAGALVLAAFVGSRPEGAECSHLNGDYRDNRLVNLAWETASQNNQRKHDHGTAAIGMRSHTAILTDEDVRAIRDRLRAGETQKNVAAAFGVSRPHVSAIKHGRAWQHVER